MMGPLSFMFLQAKYLVLIQPVFFVLLICWHNMKAMLAWSWTKTQIQNVYFRPSSMIDKHF